MLLPDGLGWGGIPWRTTFLRTHLAKELGDGSEILPLRDLSRSDDRVTPFAFFYPSNLGPRLYQPLTVGPVESSDPKLEIKDGLFARGGLGDPAGLQSEVFDLVELIRLLDTRGDPRSILLESRSGAGKTIATRAAMYECLLGIDRLPPRLAGRLPCYLRNLGGSRSSSSIEDHLSRTAGLPGEVVGRCLEQGPPLLLIVELNAVAPEARPQAAKVLIDFLRSRKGQRHRAIVTYRGHADDVALARIQLATWDEGATDPRGRTFLRADLHPMDEAATSSYLRNLRRVEARVLRQVELSETELDREIESATELIDRLDQGADGSIVSVPLLLYLVGAIGAGNLEGVATLAQLYEIMAWKFLDRERELFEAANPSPDEEAGFDGDLILTAMGRLALAILSRGFDSTVIDGALATKENLNSLMSEPGRRLASYLPKDDPDWVADRWLRSPYATWPLPPLFDARDKKTGLTTRGKGERSFLRWSPGEAGFLHDSFLYFFAARAIRWFGSPDPRSLDNQLDDAWARDVAEWWRRDPSRWSESAEFLGGLLWHREEGEADDLHELEPARRLFDLLAHLMVVPVVPDGLAAVINRLLRGRPRGRDEPAPGSGAAVLAALEAASVRPELESWPAILPSLFIHWIADLKLDDLERPAEERIATQWAEETLQPLLGSSERPVRYLEVSPPMPRPEVLDQVHHGGRVEFLECLPGGRVLSIDQRGEVRLRDPVSGGSLVAEPLWNKAPDRAFRSQLHILSRDSALYVDAAGNLFRLNWPRNLKKGRIVREPLKDFPGPVALLGLDGGEVLIRDATNLGQTVTFASGGAYVKREVFRHDAPPSGWIARLPDDRVHSWTDDEVILWDPSGRTEPIKGRYRLWSVSAAELLPGGALLAGTRDGELVRWDLPAGIKPTSLSSPPWPLPGPSVRRIVSLPNGWIFFVVAPEGDERGQVLAWKPDEANASPPINLAETAIGRELPYLETDEEQGIVLVVTNSELIRFDCQDGTPTSEPLLLGGVTAVTPAPDGRGLILGGSGGLVAWSPGPGGASGSQWWIERWNTLHERLPARIRTDSRGRIFVGTVDGQVFAVNGQLKAQDDRSWHVIDKEFRQRYSQIKPIKDLGIADIKAGRRQQITHFLQTPNAIAFASSIGQVQLIRLGLDSAESFVAWNVLEGEVNFLRWLPDQDNGKERMILGMSRPMVDGIEVKVVNLLAPIGEIEVSTWSNDDLRFPRCLLPALSDGHIVVVDSNSENIGFVKASDPLRIKGGSNPHSPLEVGLFTSLDDQESAFLASLSKQEIILVASLDEKRHVTIGAAGGVILWESAEPDEKGDVSRSLKFLYRHQIGALIRWLIPAEGGLITMAGSEALCWRPDQGVETLDTGGISKDSRALLLLQDGRLLIIGRLVVAILSLRTRELLILDRSPRETTASTLLHPDRIVLGDAEGSIRVVKIPPTPVIHRPEGRTVAMAPFGSDRLALLRASGKLATLDIASGDVEEGPEFEGLATCLAGGDEAGAVLVGTAEGRVFAWRPDRAELVPVFEHPRSLPISALKKSLEGGRVEAVDDQRIAFDLSAVASGSERPRLAITGPGPKSFAGNLTTVSVLDLIGLEDGRCVASSGDGGLYREGPPGAPWSLAYTLDEFPSTIVALKGSAVAILSASGRVSVVDLELRREIEVVSSARGAITALGALDDGRLVLGCRDGDLLISGSPGSALDRVLMSLSRINSVEVHPFGRIACVDEAGRVWVVDPRRLEPKPLDLPAKVVSVRWSGSNRLALVDSNGAVFLVDVPDVLENASMNGDLIVASGPSIRDFRFCHEGRLIVAREDATLEIASPPWLLPPKLVYREGGWGTIAAWDDGQILAVSTREAVTWVPGLERPEFLDRTPDRRPSRIATGLQGLVVFSDERDVIYGWVPTESPAEVIHDEHRARVTGLTVVHGTIVASGDERGVLILHDLATGETRPLADLGPERPIRRIEASAGWLLVKGGDELLAFPDPSGGAAQAQAGPIFPEPIRDLAASEGWPVAVVATLGNRLLAWDPAGGEPTPWGDLDPETLASLVRLVPMPGRRLMVVASGHPLMILGADGRDVERHEFHCGKIRSVVALPSGAVVFERDHDALAWLPGTEPTSSRLRWRSPIQKIVEKPDGTSYVLLGDGVVVELLDGGREGREVFRRRGRVAAREPVEGGGALVLLESGDLSLWDPDGRPTPDFARSVLTAPPTSLAALPGGLVAVGCRDGTVRLLAPPKLPDVDRPESRFHDHDESVTQVVAIPGGRVGSLDVDGQIVIRPTGPEDPVELPSRHRGRVDLLWIAPEGTLVSCGEDGILATYDTAFKHVALLPTYGKMRAIYRLANMAPGGMTLHPERGPLYFVTSMTPPPVDGASPPAATPESPAN